MGDAFKNKRKHKARPDSNTQRSGVDGEPKVRKKEYETEMFKLQVELVKLQDWAKATNARVAIISSPHRPRGRGRSSMRSATLSNSPLEVKSSSSTGVGITAVLLSS
jgi:polyphosphate kinase 2 (PPK2 family)